MAQDVGEVVDRGIGDSRNGDDDLAGVVGAEVLRLEQMFEEARRVGEILLGDTVPRTPVRLESDTDAAGVLAVVGMEYWWSVQHCVVCLQRQPTAYADIGLKVIGFFIRRRWDRGFSPISTPRRQMVCTDSHQ
ncbi:uncharacterized protein EHS24_001197 [Apiotrichum porosum]|uniref:Uncharacterized protein n=1 Tax=Apiotrichum porosum TaxID=105984 RepID=A0A427XJU0_9TREE|nr:uncharacterized protein EHS24_001197 [Apiotrichum porosum]RSH79159.1 hypothetical protein EHS24_001197 [Apiotrichum porosum]